MRSFSRPHLPSRRAPACLLVFVAGLVVLPAHAPAEVVAVEIYSRRLIANGEVFGSCGPYERILGNMYLEVDPDHSTNQRMGQFSPARILGISGFTVFFALA